MGLLLGRPRSHHRKETFVINPNPYDDDAYTKGVISLGRAVSAMWSSGATVENISDELDNAFENATGEGGWMVSVEQA